MWNVNKNSIFFLSGASKNLLFWFPHEKIHVLDWKKNDGRRTEIKERKKRKGKGEKKEKKKAWKRKGKEGKVKINSIIKERVK